LHEITGFLLDNGIGVEHQPPGEVDLVEVQEVKQIFTPLKINNDTGKPTI